MHAEDKSLACSKTIRCCCFILFCSESSSFVEIDVLKEERAFYRLSLKYMKTKTVNLQALSRIFPTAAWTRRMLLHFGGGICLRLDIKMINVVY